MGKNFLRTNAYYRYSYSDTYYEGTSEVTENVQLKNSWFSFSGVAIGYGITKRLTLDIDAGYYFSKTQNFKNIDYQARGYGFSNGNLTAKYGLFVDPLRQVELTAGAGMRFPFTTSPQSVDGVRLNRDIQPSTNAFGVSALLFFNKGFPAASLRLFSINRFDYNFSDKSDYQYGSVLLNSVFISKMVIRRLFALLQVRSEWKTNDRDHANPNEFGEEEVINSGYILLTLTPQVSYSIAGKWNLTLLCDIPFYKNYNGRQMTPKYSAAISLTRDFDLFPKPKPTPAP